MQFIKGWNHICVNYVIIALQHQVIWKNMLMQLIKDWNHISANFVIIPVHTQFAWKGMLLPFTKVQNHISAHCAIILLQKNETWKGILMQFIRNAVRFPNQIMVLGHKPRTKSPPTKSPPNRFALRRRLPLASLATGEDKYPHMLMVLGLMENRFDGT